MPLCYATIINYASCMNGTSPADLHLVSLNMPCPIAVRAELPMCSRTSLLGWLEDIAVCATNAAICRQIQRRSVRQKGSGMQGYRCCHAYSDCRMEKKISLLHMIHCLLAICWTWTIHNLFLFGLCLNRLWCFFKYFFPALPAFKFRATLAYQHVW